MNESGALTLGCTHGNYHACDLLAGSFQILCFLIFIYYVYIYYLSGFGAQDIVCHFDFILFVGRTFLFYFVSSNVVQLIKLSRAGFDLDTYFIIKVVPKELPNGYFQLYFLTFCLRFKQMTLNLLSNLLIYR